MPWLLLHGTPLTPEVWDAVIPLLDGAAAAPPVAGPLSQAGIATDIARRTNLVPPWHVVGHSFGGQVALELALQRPDLVSELTLLCTRDTPYSAFAAAADHVVAGRADVDGALQRWFSRAELADDGAATPSIRCPAVVVAAEHDQVSDPVTMEPCTAASRGRSSWFCPTPGTCLFSPIWTGLRAC